MKIFIVLYVLLFLQHTFGIENSGIEISLGARGLDLGKFVAAIMQQSIS